MKIKETAFSQLNNSCYYYNNSNITVIIQRTGVLLRLKHLTCWWNYKIKIILLLHICNIAWTGQGKSLPINTTATKIKTLGRNGIPMMMLVMTWHSNLFQYDHNFQMTLLTNTTLFFGVTKTCGIEVNFSSYLFIQWVSTYIYKISSLHHKVFDDSEKRRNAKVWLFFYCTKLNLFFVLVNSQEGRYSTQVVLFSKLSENECMPLQSNLFH